MQVNFAETVSAVTFGNGVVRIHFVNRDDKSQALAKTGENPDNAKLEYSNTLVMPLPGFLYMASIIRGLIIEPKMQEQIQKYIAAGLLPARAEDAQNDAAQNAAQNAANSQANSNQNSNKEAANKYKKN